MTISTHFDVAVHLGHLAARHLAEASHVYEHARDAGHLDLDRHDYLACLGVSGGLQMHRRAELDHAMAATVLFQAMMEKLVCFLPTLGTGLTPPKATTFAGGWENLVGQITDPARKTQATADFDFYKTTIYSGFRNPIVHGKLPADLVAIAKLRLPAAHEGLRRGWAAYDALIAEVMPDHQPSWHVLCEINGVPEAVAASDYPDLEVLAGDFVRKHLDGVNAGR
jgi:hypothetical protein